MYQRIVELIIKNRSWIAFSSAIVAALGLYAAVTLPIDAIPDITNTQVIVNTKTGALDPEQVEKTVTYYIETELAGLPRVADMRSLSRYGLSQVVVFFEDGTDVYRARQLVAERLQSVREALPGNLSPELGPISTGLGEVLIYTVKAKKGSSLERKSERERLTYLRTVQDFIIRPYLKSTIPDTAEIDAIGGYKKEVHIDFHPASLSRYGITIDDLLRRLSTLGENIGGGYIEKKGKQVIIRTDAMLDNLEIMRSVPVKLMADGRFVTLRDIAEVREDHVQRLGAATYGGKETVLGAVIMLLGANSREVARNAEHALTEISLPPDVETEIVYTRSFLVNATIQTVGENLAMGAALVVVVLLFILGNVRAAIFVSFAIPLSMLAAAVGMNFFGISANLMSLGAVDFGLLVDGSVVLIENYLRRREEQARSGAAITSSGKLSLLADSCAEVAKPVIFGLVIIMVVYVPILTLEGVEGKMFRPMALTVLMALGASLIVALVLMPVMAHYAARGGNHAESDPFLFRLIRRAYYPVLDFSLRRRAPLVSAALVIVIASGAVFYRTGSDFVPSLDEGDMSIAFVREYSIGIEEALRQQAICEKIIGSFPEVDRVFAQIGSSESSTDPMNINMADTFVILKHDRGAWPKINGKRRTKRELFEVIRSEIEKKVPGQEIFFSQPIELRFNEILEGSRADVTLRIYGKDLNTLSDLVEQAEEILRPIPGSSEVENDPITALRKSPMFTIRLNYAKMNNYGVGLQELNETIETAMGGRRIGSYYEYDWRFPVVLRMSEEHRNDFRTMAAIPVPLADGGTVPLHDLTEIGEIERVANIARHRSMRYSAVSIFLGDRDIAGYVAEAKEEIAKKLKLPEGYYIYWGGKFKNLERARARLFIMVPLVLFAIFILVLRSVGSFRQALLVYTSIPFAISGGVFALAVRDLNFSISAAVGFIAVLGIAILNGLVMVTFINQLREKGETLRMAVFSGAHKRLRPVVMTALVATLGFLPMALNTGMGAEIQRPIATVVIGGLITSTILTLVLLPTLYLWINKETN
ncbi:MAG: efflux RND transporter permease subunit [Spirochaetes bacterium]|nr:MAG: efflux RND transporter permease subunit [Spirochaetota bacterium]